MPEITNAKMDALRARMDALDNQRRLPLPTPDIGHMVLFYRNGDLNNTPIPGVVVLQGGPGQLDLKLFVRNSQNQENVTGIFYKDHPFTSDNPQVLKLKGGGVWAYCPGERPTELHKQVHLAEIDKMVKLLKEELLREREQEIRRENAQKDLMANRPERTKPEKIAS